MEPLVSSWTQRGFGFDLDGASGAHYVHHAVWCDNIIIFATNQVTMNTMIQEMSYRFKQHELFWKPSSLEVIPGGPFADDFHYEFSVEQRGEDMRYDIVSNTVLLGEFFDRVGSTQGSVQHRQTMADKIFYKRKPVLRIPGPVLPKLRAWA
eukprot:4371787-Pyramimonas_sp.AAC.1